MNNEQINKILFSTNSSLFNKGISLYKISEPKVTKHLLHMQMDFDDETQIPLETIENFLAKEVDLTIVRYITSILNDAYTTFEVYGVSAARFGILFSHKNLIDSMRPHIHRHAYAKQLRPCISMHYSLARDCRSVFEYYQPIDIELIRENDLCDNQNIINWCSNKPKSMLFLAGQKNVVLFDSARTPHNAVHGEALDAYVIFDNVILRKEVNVVVPLLLESSRWSPNQ